MKVTSKFKSIENQDIAVEFITPNECPICHSGIEPTIYGGSIDGAGTEAYLSLHCGCRKCNSSFLSRYDVIGIDLNQAVSLHTYAHKTRFKCSEPIKTRKITFDKHIESVSSSFVEIYNQAKIAEDSGLTHLCGIGYRKSLEFLIKDYALYIHQEDESIADKPLSQCIKDYLDNDNLKHVATAAAWIGNDETHYTKKHEDYNLDDLKMIINATVSYITTELITLEAMKIFPRKV